MDPARLTENPPEVPAGWKAAWSDEHKEWFYVNLNTAQTTWDKPTDVAAPSYNGRKIVIDPSSYPTDPESTGADDGDDKLPDYAAARAARRQNDLNFENEILSDYEFEDKSALSDESTTEIKAWSRKSSCRVLIKRYSKSDKAKVAAVQRELNALYVLGGNDNTIPPLLDYFDPAGTVFVICETRQDESLKQYIEGRGPLTGDLLKAVVTQLMSALSNIFLNGFAHLKMCDETLSIDAYGQLTIKDFQYAIPYGKEKTDTLYAAVGHEVKGTEGIWRAPEVFAAEKEGVEYNGRKAVIWSCGIVLYYMVTGQLEKLSNLDHPVFMSRRASQSKSTGNTNTNNTIEEGTVSNYSNGSGAPAEEASPRRRSILGYRRRSSAAGPSSSSSSSHGRKGSYSATLPTPHTLVSYPGNRLDVPSYARDIISKMLILNPYERAELIEVAAKVPKEIVTKQTRPLMELAWQDYKTHVGPYAGMGLGADEWNSGGYEYADSMYSGMSGFSYGFSGLLGKKR